MREPSCSAWDIESRLRSAVFEICRPGARSRPLTRDELKAIREAILKLIDEELEP